MLASWQDRFGELQSVTSIPGRCRFGEVAIIACLQFSNGRQLMEYSFGDQEVGSIGPLSEFPNRPVYPATASRFVNYVPADHATWSVDFELDPAGWPTALLLQAEEAVRAPKQR
jgi:hypothetical protein